MGETATPRPYYFKNGVIVFFVREKQVYYNIWMWNESGLMQFSVESGKFDGDYNGLIERAQHNFGDVIRG